MFYLFKKHCNAGESVVKKKKVAAQFSIIFLKSNFSALIKSLKNIHSFDREKIEIQIQMYVQEFH